MKKEKLLKSQIDYEKRLKILKKNKEERLLDKEYLHKQKTQVNFIHPSF
jgi:hypothetical protein